MELSAFAAAKYKGRKAFRIRADNRHAYCLNISMPEWQIYFAK
jgi:hypothetical protein